MAKNKAISLYKEKIENFCKECNKPTRITKLAVHHPEGKGMFWECEDGHKYRSRNYTVKLIKAY